jgi:hypothetical protein
MARSKPSRPDILPERRPDASRGAGASFAAGFSSPAFDAPGMKIAGLYEGNVRPAETKTPIFA